MLALALAPAAHAAAQQPGAPAALPGLGTVRGVVYDSLAGRPLAGARVWTADGRRATVADADGRFALDSVAATGAAVGILAEHPAADSVGLSTLAAAVRLAPGGSATVTVAIPSFATLRAAACRGIVDAGERGGGILFGVVRNAATGNPVAGAVTTLSWLRFRGASGLGGRNPADVVVQGLDALTDGSGMYYACGVPVDDEIAVRAAAALPDSVASVELTVTIGGRRVLRRDLVVGGPGGGTVVARVRSAADGRPLAGARVFVDDAEPVLTNERGDAVVRDAPAGTRRLSARLIGFTPAETAVDVAAGDTARRELRLERVQQLAAVRVHAIRKLEEVEQRRRTGQGYIVTGEVLESRPTLRSVFWSVPSVRTEGTGAFDLQLLTRSRMGTWCAMTVYIDGRRSIVEELLMFRPDELLAVEVYPRPAFAPARYVSAVSDQLCGVVLVWTR